MPALSHCPKCGAALTDFTDHEGRSRRKCADCGFIHYDNPTPVVGAIVEHGSVTELLGRSGGRFRALYERQFEGAKGTDDTTTANGHS